MLRELFIDGILLILAFGIVGLLISIKHSPEWFRRARSASWPLIPGTIEGGEVSTLRTQSRYWDRGIEAATATVAYSYALEGTYYAGYHVRTFNDEQKAWSYVDGLKGKAVQVSYNPRKPDISVLRKHPTFIV